MSKILTALQIRDFQHVVTGYYLRHQRRLPWREPNEHGVFDPYQIMVSEIMLQQTQVARVVPKYQAFLVQFPNIEVLAAAPLGAVLAVWVGLGYNRRAKFLWQAARMVMEEYQGIMPTTIDGLARLPGVGKNTAGAIMTYAYNQPAVFVETNIRTVFLHHFFSDETAVSDKQILELVQDTLPSTGDSRDWYWALMDYGTHLKAAHGTHLARSSSYKKQSPFTGSLRQVRGAVVRALAEGKHSYSELACIVSDERLGRVLVSLQKEGMVMQNGQQYHLAE